MKSYSITCDRKVNAGRPHIVVLLFLYRLAQRTRQWPVFWRWLSVPVGCVYRGTALTVFSVDIPISTAIGPELMIHHGFGIVVHNEAVIGSHVTLRQNVTIGSNSRGAPTIGDRVDFGAAALVIGPVRVGDDARVGAGSVVVRDVPAAATVVGNPAHIVGREANE